jgi:O-antigen/teichoic acid export membrane protein
LQLRTKLFLSALQIAGGHIGQQIVLFVRNIFIARLLPEEHFGIALTLMTVLIALDVLTDIGIEIYIVRSPDSGDIRLQKTLQGLLIGRSLMTAAAMFLLGGIFASLFGVPEFAWVYRSLAVVPLIRGFLHLDFRRFERAYNFWPGIIITSISIVAGALVAVAVAYAYRTPFAIVVGAAVQAATFVVGSHVVAEKDYGLAYDGAFARAVARFGAPLVLNGILIFGLSQGDRVVIASVLGVRELEIYGVVALLTSGIMLLFAKLTSAIYVPVLAEHAPGTATYLKRYEACGAATALMSLAALIAFAFLGRDVVALAFGQKFSPEPLLVTLLAVQLALKNMRSWPQKALLANAQTSQLFLSNLIAALGLVAAFFAARAGYGIEGVAECVVAAEMLAVLHAIYVVAKIPGMAWIGAKLMTLVIAASAALLTMQKWELGPEGMLDGIATAIGTGLGAFALVFLISPALSQVTRELAGRVFKTA